MMQQQVVPQPEIKKVEVQTVEPAAEAEAPQTVAEEDKISAADVAQGKVAVKVAKANAKKNGKKK